VANGTGYVLGIDLGTTFTAAAVAREGRADIVSLGHASAVVPSVVLVRDDGEILVGEAAERRASSEPTRVAREFKRRLGDPVPFVLGGTPYGAEALSAHLLRSVYERVVEQQGGAPDAVVLTHPANFGEYKLDLMREMVRLADIPDVEFLTEPEAAATHYGEQDRLEPGDVVAVYDFGGGTFDAAVLRVDESGFELLGTPEGMERLGGIDFDQAVYSHVMSTLGDAGEELDAGDAATLAALGRIREECREAKEALSSDTDADVPVLLPNLHTDVRITRTELEAMIRPRIAETIESLGRAVRSAGLEPEQVTKVLLVGGTSRIPLVAEMVADATGRPVATDAHPKHAIAEGAALQAWRAKHPAAVVAGAAPVGAAAAGAATAGAAGGGGVGDATGSAPPTVGPDGEGDDGKRRVALIGAIVVVLALVVGAGLFFLRSGDDDEASADVVGATSVSPSGSESPAATTVPAADASAVESVPSTDAPPTTEPPPTTEAETVIVTAGEVILEPATASGDAPFTESVAAEASPELLAFSAAGGRITEEAPAAPTSTVSTETTAPAQAGTTTLTSRTGDEPGLYGGTRSESACDRDQLASFLDQQPEIAVAWADVHEIAPDEIPDYLALLTPTLLTRDTRVTNHLLVDGEAVPRQAVLQAGTAVLVDDAGVARVRCSSGSPLLPAEPVEGTTTYRGDVWETFEPAETVVVAPAPEPLTEFVLFDIVAGDEFIRPAGTAGAADRAALPGEVVALGSITSFPGYDGSLDTNEMRMIFRPEGGPVEATFTYSLTYQGVTLSGDGDLTGTFDPATNTMSGSGFGQVQAGGFGGGGSGDWTATVDPGAGVVAGEAGDADGTATFELTFEPYTPPDL
jgi:actin-like ATPase involved in cell morphogenesis